MATISWLDELVPKPQLLEEKDLLGLSKLIGVMILFF